MNTPMKPSNAGGSLHRAGWGSRLHVMQLTERDRAILDFERSWWAEPGVKETTILERFELSASRYYQILGELLECAEAMQYDPLLIRRLRRMRDSRRRARYVGRSVDGHPAR